MSTHGSCFYFFATRRVGSFCLPIPSIAAGRLPWRAPPPDMPFLSREAESGHQEQVVVVGSASIRAPNCNRNQSVTRESEALIEVLKESYGYTSDLKAEAFSWFSTSKCQFATDNEIGDNLCRRRM